MTKEDILNEIKRTARENGGKPLGMGRFQKETGIKPYDWGKYWVRFGDAQREAGFESNTLNKAYTDDFLLEKIVQIIHKIRKFPTSREINFERRSDLTIPDFSTFSRFGTKEQLADKVIAYCTALGGHNDIIDLCKTVTRSDQDENVPDDDEKIKASGEVYLFRSGKYYKIGKTNDTVRRGTELRIQLPEELDLIHSIKTDDPSGVESYWHRRFESKRKNGEWFDLAPSDIKAFRAWRRIV